MKNFQRSLRLQFGNEWEGTTLNHKESCIFSTTKSRKQQSEVEGA